MGFYAVFLDTWHTGVKSEDIPIVRGFLDVFPEKLPSVLIERKDEFGINVMPVTQSIS